MIEGCGGHRMKGDSFISGKNDIADTIRQIHLLLVVWDDFHLYRSPQGLREQIMEAFRLCSIFWKLKPTLKRPKRCGFEIDSHSVLFIHYQSATLPSKDTELPEQGVPIDKFKNFENFKKFTFFMILKNISFLDLKTRLQLSIKLQYLKNTFTSFCVCMHKR